MSEMQMSLICRHNAINMSMLYSSSDVEVYFQHL